MTRLSGSLVLLALAACDDKADDSGGRGETCPTGTIEVTDANNYSYEGSIDVPVEVTAEADVEVCWTDITLDIQCHDVDPVDDIDNVNLIRFGHLDQEGVEQGLSGNTLQQADISGYVALDPGDDTCIMLSDLSFFGTPIDIEEEYTEDGGTYLLTLNTGLMPGVGARSLVFLQPSATSKVTHVDVPDNCGVLQFEADLGALDTVPVCATGSWTFDWGAITRNGHGDGLETIDIDTAMVGFYEGMTAADLQEQFLDLELIATQMWQAELDGGHEVDLAQLSDGTSFFSGFSGEGAWMFALRCSTCSNPAPVFLTLLDVVSP